VLLTAVLRKINNPVLIFNPSFRKYENQITAFICCFMKTASSSRVLKLPKPAVL
jgi:hypothetical protein